MFDKLYHDFFIFELFEVGLLSLKTELTVRISPDDITVIRIMDMIT